MVAVGVTDDPVLITEGHTPRIEFAGRDSVPVLNSPRCVCRSHVLRALNRFSRVLTDILEEMHDPIVELMSVIIDQNTRKGGTIDPLQVRHGDSRVLG